jgi:hypothetical protein
MEVESIQTRIQEKGEEGIVNPLRRWHGLLASAAILATLLVTASSIAGAAAPTQRQAPSNTMVFSIPIGNAGPTYHGVGVPDMLAWGPASFAAAPDGSFWIADTATSRVLRYSVAGQQLDRLDLSDDARGLSDIKVTASEIVAPDSAAAPPPASSPTAEIAAPADARVWQAVRHALPGRIPVYQPGFVAERFGAPVVEEVTAEGTDGPHYTVVSTASEERLVFIHGAGKGAWGNKPPPETETAIAVNGAPGTL